MALKYAAHLQVRPDQPCPCMLKFSAKSRTAFRYMRNEATDSDFVPVALLDGFGAKDKCEKFALSFFESVDHAVARWKSLVERLGNMKGGIDHGLKAAAERYGDHVGEIALVATDGVIDDPHPRSGHISLHEADGVSFVGRVSVYTPLVYADAS